MAKAKASRANPPAKIPLAYRKVGETHVFTASGFTGFYMGHAELRIAYENVARALGEHVSKVSGRKVDYALEMGYADFARTLEGDGGSLPNFITAKRESAHAPERRELVSA